ncbi:MAG: peptidoglycan editing factor PgeF [Pseudomonadota bacterium]
MFKPLLDFEPELIVPDWPAPACVRAYSTTRRGGVSAPPYGEFNLAAHVGDDVHGVRENRARLAARLDLPAPPLWLDQVHGARVVDAAATDATPQADAAYTSAPRTVCAVLTADCLPLLLCDRAGTRVAAVHAGWRGLAAGVIEATLRAMQMPGSELLAWMGPAIGPRAFEVGGEMRELFVRHDAHAARAFQPAPGQKWLADIYQLARLRLAACGVHAVYGARWCTVSDARFYSYRRDGVTGRMATVIWMEGVRGVRQPSAGEA